MSTAGNRPSSTFKELTAFRTAERNVITALAEMREIVESLSRRETPSSSDTAGEILETVCLSEGELDSHRLSSFAEAALWIERSKWNVIVHEIEEQLQIRMAVSERVWDLHHIPHTVRGWLWLILTHVGGTVSHGDIASLFDLPEKGRDSRIHQMRLRVGQALGRDLSERVFGRSVNRVYPVNRTGWSFLWIRRSASREKSCLLTTELIENMGRACSGQG